MKRSLFAVLTFVVLGASLLFWLCIRDSVPSAQDEGRLSSAYLKRLFEANRTTFETLDRMAIEDGLQNNPFRPSVRKMADIPVVRQARYAELIATLKPPFIAAATGIDNPRDLNFCFARGGLGPIGIDWNEGIRRIPGDPKEDGVILVANLDQAVADDRYTYLQQLDHNWYLFYECQ